MCYKALFHQSRKIFRQRPVIIVPIRICADWGDTMAVNRGKQFEKVVQEAFEKIPGVSIDRLHDQTTGFAGSTNICDFIVYKKPYQYYIECKSVHGNTLSIHSVPKPGKDGKLHGFYGNITDNQWKGLLEKSKIPGVFAGVLCWWVDKDVTKFIPIQSLQELYLDGAKSLNPIYNSVNGNPIITLKGQKKRVFFEYDLKDFLDNINRLEGRQYDI